MSVADAEFFVDHRMVFILDDFRHPARLFEVSPMLCKYDDILPESVTLCFPDRDGIRYSAVHEMPVVILYTGGDEGQGRSEEHTSELQSRFDLVCRLLLEKKKR